MENTNVGQVLPDNKGYKAAVLKGTPSSVPVLQPTGQALLTGYLSTHGEAASFNAPSTFRERGECVSTGMRGKTTSGFTLIELLVVVLIIGILAAVALPQYQKAVLKSRFAALKPLAKTIKHAQEIYFNEHGEYATQLSALDIQAPAEAELELSDTDGHEFVRATKTGLDNRYTMYLDHSTNFAGNTYCEAPVHDGTDATLADEVCLSDGGQDVSLTNNGYKLYLLSGSSTGSLATGPRLTETVYNQRCPDGSGPCTQYNYTDGSSVLVKDGGYELEINMCPADGSRCVSYIYWNTGGDRSCRNGCEGETDFCDRFPDIEQCQS